MKNRPWLIIALTAVLLIWSLYQSLGGLEGFQRAPVVSLGTIGVAVLIAIPVLWFQFRRLKRQPMYVEVQERERGAPIDPLLHENSLVLKASTTKRSLLFVQALLLLGFAAFTVWGQPGMCRVAGVAAFGPLVSLALVLSVSGLIRPERLEIARQGLKHVTLWRSRFWSWDEIRNITVGKGRAFGFVWTSMIYFNRFAADAFAAGPSRVALRPIWPMQSDKLAALLNDARLQWSSARGSNFVAVRKSFEEYLNLALVGLAVGIMLWIFIGHPCGP